MTSIASRSGQFLQDVVPCDVSSGTNLCLESRSKTTVVHSLQQVLPTIFDYWIAKCSIHQFRIWTHHNLRINFGIHHKVLHEFVIHHAVLNQFFIHHDLLVTFPSSHQKKKWKIRNEKLKTKTKEFFKKSVGVAACADVRVLAAWLSAQVCGRVGVGVA